MLHHSHESQNQFAQNQHGNAIRGTRNGLGRTRRNQSSGGLAVRVPQAQPGPNNKEKRNMQEDQNSGSDPVQMLTHVLQLVQNLPLDPNEKEQLQTSLQWHVVPILQPKKSTADCGKTDVSVLNAKHDQVVANVRAVAIEISVLEDSFASLDAELLSLHSELQLPPGPSFPAL